MIERFVAPCHLVSRSSEPDRSGDGGDMFSHRGKDRRPGGGNGDGNGNRLWGRESKRVGTDTRLKLVARLWLG